jgi:formylglycine-generating enzyme required for sulfatase activity
MKECPTCKTCFPDDFNNCPTDGQKLKVSIEGDTILDNRYQLDRRLGQGGMGIVFQARHIMLKSTFAIKVILPDLVGNDSMLITRFRQEAMVAARLRHQNLVNVTDFGVVHGMPYLVMELIKGISLHDLLGREGRLSPHRALHVMSGVVAGVGAAHREGVIHRDLKPLNIMITTGDQEEGVKVLDFGLAKIKSGELLGSFVAAQTTALMGSPSYMAPELWSDEDPDARTDIYSLGVILFQMLSGEVPFRGGTVPSVMKKHLTEPPPRFAEEGVKVPSEIEDVVHRALAKNREERHESVYDFLEEFRAAVGTMDPAFMATISGLDISADARTIRLPEVTIEQQILTERQQDLEEEAKRLKREFEEAQRRADEARQRAEEAARRKVEEEAERRKAEEEAARKLAEEEAARQRAEETARKQAAEEAARRKEEEEAGQKRLAEEARKRAEDEAERKRVAEEAARLARELTEVQGRAEEARLRADEEARKRTEEAAARQRAEEEARKLLLEVEETKRRADEARQRAEEEAQNRAAEMAARYKAEAEEARQRAEEAARQRREEDEARKVAAAEADRLSKEVAEAQRRAEEARQRAEEEAERRAAEEAARRKAEEEARRLAQEVEEAQHRVKEARKRSEEEAARKDAEQKAQKLELEVAEANQRLEEARKRAEDEAFKRAEEEKARRKLEEEAARQRAEDEARRRKEETEARKRAAADADRLTHEVAEAQQRAEEARKHAEAEAERRAAEEAARRKAEEEARRLAQEIEEAERRVEEVRKRSEEARAQAEAEAERKRQEAERRHQDELAAAAAFQQSHPSLPGTAHTQPELLGSMPSIAARSNAKTVTVVVIGVVLLVLVGGGFLVWRLAGTKSSPQPVAGPTTPPTSPPRAHPVEVKGGTFQMGLADIEPKSSREGYDWNQWPAHTVSVKDFSMDQTEVTNAEYAAFVTETKHAAPSYWREGKPGAGQEQFPVTNVSLDDANAFAHWRSKRDSVTYRLPTEEEWEYAARNGSQDTVYPWGNDWRNECANVDNNPLAPVSSNTQCGSQAGILDLIGNVWEWTSSTAAVYQGNSKWDSLGLPQPKGQVIRGGAYDEPSHGAPKITATRRSFVAPTTKLSTLGFRLVHEQ